MFLTQSSCDKYYWLLSNNSHPVPPFFVCLCSRVPAVCGLVPRDVGPCTVLRLCDPVLATGQKRSARNIWGKFSSLLDIEEEILLSPFGDCLVWIWHWELRQPFYAQGWLSGKVKIIRVLDDASELLNWPTQPVIVLAPKGRVFCVTWQKACSLKYTIEHCLLRPLFLPFILWSNSLTQMSDKSGSTGHTAQRNLGRTSCYTLETTYCAFQ